MSNFFAALLFLISLLALSGCAHVSSSQSRTIASACTQKISDEILHGTIQVPQYLFHFGRGTVLARDVAERTVPLSDWNDFIVGEKTSWRLPRFRRGLYGTEKALRADAFANPDDPGLLRIEIKPACREPSKVGTTLGLDLDARFRDWIGTGFSVFVQKCISARGDLLVRNYSGTNESTPSNAMLECEKIVDDFFNAHDIRIVQDEVIDASWYIRDRACIQTIEGTSGEILQWMGEGGFFSADRCSMSVASLSTFRIFLSSLLKEAPNTAQVERLRAEWEKAKLISPPTSEWADKFLAAYIRCTEKNSRSELLDAVRDFDAELSGIKLYDYFIRSDDEAPTEPFSSLCR